MPEAHIIDAVRTCWFSAGLPEEVPVTTIYRHCGSAQQTVSVAAMATKPGVHDVVDGAGIAR